MPGMNGFEVLEHIKREPHLQTLPVVVVSALNELESVGRCIELGAEDYLVKPINSKLLKSRITNCIDKKRHRDLEQAHHEELARSKTQLEHVYAQVEKMRDDLASILNQLEIGTILINDKGNIDFISEVASNIFNQSREDAHGQAWEKVLALPKAQETVLKTMMKAPPHERSKVSMQFDSSLGKRFWLEVDTKEDPQDPTRKLFVFYDTTEIHDLRQIINKETQFQDLVGKSQAMREVINAL